MKNMKKYCVFIILPLFLCISCLHTKTDDTAGGVQSGVKIMSGNATLRITGRITEELNGKPAKTKEKMTKNETKKLSAGKEYAFSVLLGEVVTIIVRSSDGNNVELITYQSGREKRFTVQGTDKTGLSVVFQYIRYE